MEAEVTHASFGCVDQCPTETAPPALRVDVQRVQLTLAGHVAVTARPDRDEATDLTVRFCHEHVDARIGKPLSTMRNPLADVECVQHVVGNEPAIGDLPRSQVERGDRLCVGELSLPHHTPQVTGCSDTGVVLDPEATTVGAKREMRSDTHTVRLRDGRRLAYDEVGAARGVPVLYFHGGGDSRLTRHPDDAIAEELGVRLIAIDRPGCGRSDFAPRRTLVHWAADIERLVDTLGLDRFAVLGWSAGGPHALACARVLRDRVERAVVVGGLPEPRGFVHLPPDLQLTFFLARANPRLVVRPLAVWGLRPPPSAGDPACDPSYAAGRVEAFRQGSRGLAWELHMLARPWGFRPEDIRVPVSLWYGDYDRVCPIPIGRDFAARIPGARLTIVPDRHQLLFTRWRDLLAEF